MNLEIAGALFGLLLLLLVSLAQWSKSRLDRVGEAWRPYGAARGLVYTPVRGGYHYARSLGHPPTLKGTIEGVEITILATDRWRTFVSAPPPAWFPEGGAAAISRPAPLFDWMSTRTRTGDATFDAALRFGMSPTDAVPRFASAELRRRALELATFPDFTALTCHKVHRNRNTYVVFRGLVLTTPELDAAVAALLTIHCA